MEKLFGIDFGTGGCKATLIDLEGNILASAFQEYPSIHQKPGWSEQDPALWLEAFVQTVRACREQMPSANCSCVNPAFRLASRMMSFVLRTPLSEYSFLFFTFIIISIPV